MAALSEWRDADRSMDGDRYRFNEAPFDVRRGIKWLVIFYSLWLKQSTDQAMIYDVCIHWLSGTLVSGFEI